MPDASGMDYAYNRGGFSTCFCCLFVFGVFFLLHYLHLSQGRGRDGLAVKVLFGSAVSYLLASDRNVDFPLFIVPHSHVLGINNCLHILGSQGS